MTKREFKAAFASGRRWQWIEREMLLDGFIWDGGDWRELQEVIPDPPVRVATLEADLIRHKQMLYAAKPTERWAALWLIELDQAAIDRCRVERRRRTGKGRSELLQRIERAKEVPIGNFLPNDRWAMMNGQDRQYFLCPFHKEKSPSFMWDKKKNTFHCFGCNKHGDVIDLVRHIFDLSFGQALERLGA